MVRLRAAKQPCLMGLRYCTYNEQARRCSMGRQQESSASARIAGSHRFLTAEHVIQRPEPKEEEQRYGSIVRVLLRYLHWASTAAQ